MRQAKLSAFKKNIQELYIVPPNDLGIPIVTSWYRAINKFFKSMPFLIIVPLTILIFILLALVSQHIIIRLATFIQYGY